ncbi:MAG TPA: Clp protease N-terminal domain-containing protein [Nocardioidaceae bacterium]|jgi:ATP-dependent Clp protease ATP-binding subunit ClpA|nr:Clp protease N-terminal domain-containing protein [Nocardioidaceae bacterium]
MLERFIRPTRRVVEAATRIAGESTASQVRPEHLLLGLARVGDRVVGATLDEVGVTPSALRPAVLEATRRAG